MSWSDWKIRAGLLAGLAAVSGAAAADAATMVVRSTGPSAKLYPPGKALPDDARIALKANDMVTLLDARGTRTLSGPGLFTPASPPTQVAGMSTTLAALAGGGGARRARIGAVRGAAAADPAKSPNVWYVDATKSATVCVADPTTVTLWRPGADATTATIAGAGRTETAVFVKGQQVRPWPTTLPVTDGAQYTLRWKGAAAPQTLKFVLVGTAPTQIESMAAMLISRGCQRQLDMLIETVAVPAPAPKAAG